MWVLVELSQGLWTTFIPYISSSEITSSDARISRVSGESSIFLPNDVRYLCTYVRENIIFLHTYIYYLCVGVYVYKTWYL